MSVHSPVSQFVYIALCPGEMSSASCALGAPRSVAGRPKDKTLVDSFSPRSPRPTASTPGTSYRTERLVADGVLSLSEHMEGRRNASHFDVEREEIEKM